MELKRDFNEMGEKEGSTVKQALALEASFVQALPKLDKNHNNRVDKDEITHPGTNLDANSKKVVNFLQQGMNDLCFLRTPGAPRYDESYTQKDIHHMADLFGSKNAVVKEAKRHCDEGINVVLKQTDENSKLSILEKMTFKAAVMMNAERDKADLLPGMIDDLEKRLNHLQKILSGLDKAVKD